MEHYHEAIEANKYNDALALYNTTLSDSDVKAKTAQIIEKYVAENNTEKVKKLTAIHDIFVKNAPNRVRRCMSKVTKELFPYFLAVRRANILAWKEEAHQKALEDLQELENLYKEILDRGECVCIKELAVDGKDLMTAGVKQGKQIGEILSDLLETVLEEPEKNEKEILLAYVKETYF